MSPFQQDADLKNLVDAAFVHGFLNEPVRLRAAALLRAFKSNLEPAAGQMWTLPASSTPNVTYIPEGWVLRLDDRGVANLGHHARHHVVEIVAVKRPAAGVVGVEGDGDATHRRHKDGISHGTCELGTVYRHHLEGVAVEMHRMRHHRVVHHFDHVTMEAGLPEFLNRRLVNFGRWICPETG